MKKRLRQILSRLCILALALSCVTTAALAESTEQKEDYHVIGIEWSDDNNADGNRPDSITARYGAKTVTLKAPDWTDGVFSVPAASWELLGFESNGYNRPTILPEDNGITIVKISKETAQTTSKSAEVKWDDAGYESLRPESLHLILLNTYASGKEEPIGEPKLVKAPGWKENWTNLPVKDAEGNNINYTVKQMEALAAYDTDYENGELKVTNTIRTGSLKLNVSLDAPEGADLSGLKLILDGPDPYLKKTLTYDDVKGGSITLGKALEGAYLIRDTNADTLVEGYVMDPANSKVADAVYVTSGKSATLEFKYTWKLQEPIDEEVEEDYDPLANIGNLTFEILGPDALTTPLTIKYSDFKNGKYELPNLVPGVYTVVERNAETLVKYYTLTSNSTTGLAVEVKADGKATARLFNQYVTPPTPEPDAEFVDIPVTKTWNDNNNADGNRPASVTARLYADGVEVDSHVLTAAENWQFTFVEKPRYQEDNKTEIVYTVGEDAVAMYAATVNGYNIVNDYQPEVTSVSVSKVWDDNNNEQNLRPDSIAMSLSDGQKVVKVVVLSEANGWTATVNNLPTVVNGQNAQYAWKEQQVLSYSLEGVTQQGNLMIFTNKVWERPENPTAGRRPKTRGNTWYVFEDYDTPLGVSVVINHVGDCFD